MEQTAYIVTDMGFGDSGKGGTVDFLTATNPNATVIRHNGGAQAGHNVIAGDGRHHTFAQWGCGTFRGCRTFLSRFMGIHPTAMMKEGEILTYKGVMDPFTLLDVSLGALIITPIHQILNRTREMARGEKRHGTCGLGYGEAVSMSYSHHDATVRVADLYRPDELLRKLRRQKEIAEVFASEMGLGVRFDPEDYILRLQEFARRINPVDEETYLKKLVASGKPIVSEGAQGVLLDKWHGFHPHTTWSDTTHANALTLLREMGFSGRVHRIGCLRTYLTRHGEGPFPSQAGLTNPEFHNSPAGWQGQFRQGHFDPYLACYALEACGGVDSIALSHLDRIQKEWTYVDDYGPDFPGLDVRPTPMDDTLYQDHLLATLRMARPSLKTMRTTGEFLNPYDVVDKVSELLEGETFPPVGLASFGPRSTDKINLGVPVHYNNVQRRKETT